MGKIGRVLRSILESNGGRQEKWLADERERIADKARQSFLRAVEQYREYLPSNEGQSSQLTCHTGHIVFEPLFNFIAVEVERTDDRFVFRGDFRSDSSQITALEEGKIDYYSMHVKTSITVSPDLDQVLEVSHAGQHFSTRLPSGDPRPDFQENNSAGGPIPVNPEQDLDQYNLYVNSLFRMTRALGQLVAQVSIPSEF